MWGKHSISLKMCRDLKGDPQSAVRHYKDHLASAATFVDHFQMLVKTSSFFKYAEISRAILKVQCDKGHLVKATPFKDHFQMLEKQAASSKMLGFPR